MNGKNPVGERPPSTRRADVSTTCRKLWSPFGRMESGLRRLCARVAAWERAPAGSNGLGGLSRVAMGRTRFLRRSVEKGIEFGGWWVRDDAFEVTIPVVGELSVMPAPRVLVEGWDGGSRRTVAEFIEGAIYRYRVPIGEQELSGFLDRAADEAIRNAVGQIEHHLVSLGPARVN